MFSKAAKASETGSGPASRPAVASLVAEGVRLRGDVSTAGDLHLDGVLDGELTVGRLTLGETGCVNGSIQADSVEIRGRVVGTLTALRVRLCATAHVEGDIRHAELAIEAGARFEGRSLAFDAAAAVEPLALVSAAE